MLMLLKYTDINKKRPPGSNIVFVFVTDVVLQLSYFTLLISHTNGTSVVYLRKFNK